MVLTTSQGIEGRLITAYLGIVSGEALAVVNFPRDITGGRAASLGDGLLNARTEALREMERRANEMGADAVVGVDLDYEVLGAEGNMLMVTASGTAVKHVDPETLKYAGFDWNR